MYNEEPATYFAPLGYTNVYVVAEAITRAGTLEKEALITALEATSYVSPVGEDADVYPVEPDRAPRLPEAEDPPVAERRAASGVAV